MFKTFCPLYNRDDFPMLSSMMQGHPLVYFDSAATSLKPKSVIETLTHFCAHEYGTVHRAVYDLSRHSTERYFSVRAQVQKFLNAQHIEEIVFTKGTTEGINLVASCFGEAFLEEGDELIISEMEHHSNIVPWQSVCKKKKDHLKVIPVTKEGVLDLQAYTNLLSYRTKLVAVTHISNALGTINPIEEMIGKAHMYGAKVLIDGAQSAPHQKIDVQKLDADFFVFSGHKMLGPTGIGILYGKKELLNALPPYQGGGDMIRTVTFEETTYQEAPLRFEAGTPPIIEVMGLGAALSYLESYGLDRILLYEQELISYALDLFSQIEEIVIFGPKTPRGPILTFQVPNVHALDVGTFLNLKGIAVRTGNLCTQPLMHKMGAAAFIRASFAPYNTAEEIERCARELKEIIYKLKD